MQFPDPERALSPEAASGSQDGQTPGGLRVLARARTACRTSRCMYGFPSSIVAPDVSFRVRQEYECLTFIRVLPERAAVTVAPDFSVGARDAFIPPAADL